MTVSVDVEELRGFRSNRGHHVLVIPVAKFAARIHEEMGGEAGFWTKAHDHQNVRPSDRLKSTWSGRAIAALVIPALILLVVWLL